ncbi:two-component system response regulator [Trueperella bernardiae]|uniref:two-component system response regulator n=1 Tax=Trueperella bernardiae TaxID=59561 RepID=UPI002889541C|nr:two-component system response regulator [Trueperella bernardiae]
MTQDAGKTSVDVLVYSDNRDTRNDVMRALGRRVGKGPAINWTEAATWEGAYLLVEENHFDLLILDGEAAKLGGIGFGKMVRDELVEDMPYIVLIGRPQDEWLARVSAPNAILNHPVDARALSAAVADVLGETLNS